MTSRIIYLNVQSERTLQSECGRLDDVYINYIQHMDSKQTF